MDYDFVKRILNLVEQNLSQVDPNDILRFTHEFSVDNTERVITVHPTEDGFIVFSVFNNDEWTMVNNICEISEKPIDEVIYELAKEGDSSTVVIDPRQF
jgi:hypothetical protein